MAELSRDDVRRIIGPVDDAVVAKVDALGTIREELAEAHAWMTSDESLLNEGRSPPTGRALRMLELI